MTMIQLRTSRLSRQWLIENYARFVKENGCGAVNTNNTMENSKNALQAQCIAHILLNNTFFVRKSLMLMIFTYIYMQMKHMSICLAIESSTN